MRNLTIFANERGKSFRGVGDGKRGEGPLFVDMSGRQINVIVRRKQVVELQTRGILKGSQ